MQVEEALRAYIASLDAQLGTGVAGEHAYRPALQRLLEELLPGFTVTNEPARVACGAPDLLVAEAGTRIPAAYVECKDIGDADLAGEGKNREQFARYRASLGCVIFTDYLDFRLYLDGAPRLQARVGELAGGRLRELADGAAAFRELLAVASSAPRAQITTPSRLAEVMAGKARLLAQAVDDALRADADAGRRAGYASRYLRNVYASTRQELVHDLSEGAFADLYAQTITYGLFVARLHHEGAEPFTRQEAARLIPRAIPFLRRAFQDIAGFDLDPRIAWIVDDLAGAFARTNTQTLLAGYYASRGETDLLMHFYEDFLSAYSPRLRRARGVWYTPAPVVRFIVGAVDDLLRQRFGLHEGLADSSVAERAVRNPHTGETWSTQMHRVQLLDPAAGTGTFLAEVVRRIYTHFEGQPASLWQDYVSRHLLPRLMGFELLMSSYAVAHLKLDTTLAATGYRLGEGDRFSVYLTNSLEPYALQQARVSVPWLSDEGEAANCAKLKRPVMVMLGNPPYNISSSNRGKWIENLIGDYKQGLKERNIQPLSDDYIKFIRLGQHYVEQTGEGILAYITNNSFLDGISHRQMRHGLLRAFDTIYILNLHGSARLQEQAPDGGRDENVFDIMQGVSINIFVKDGSKRGAELAEVFYHDLWGTRAAKFDFLERCSLDTVCWARVVVRQPSYRFVPQNFSLAASYRKSSFSVVELFPARVSGIQTSVDELLVHDTPEGVRALLRDLRGMDAEAFRAARSVGPDRCNLSVAGAQADIEGRRDEDLIRGVSYRIFSKKYIPYSENSSGVIARPRHQVMRHMLADNVALVAARKTRGAAWSYAFCVDGLADRHLFSILADVSYVFPLWIYSEDYSRREANMDAKIFAKLEKRAGRAVTPEEAFDYVYGALHDGAYRARYAELLKMDFPRVPYPIDGADFESQRAKGASLRGLHLMEGASGWPLETTFHGEGDTAVESPAWRNGRIYINATQYFAGARREAWEFCIGGYAVAQKWLKDRGGERLGYDGVQQYRRVLHALSETARMVNGGQ